LLRRARFAQLHAIVYESRCDVGLDRFGHGNVGPTAGIVPELQLGEPAAVDSSSFGCARVLVLLELPNLTQNGGKTPGSGRTEFAILPRSSACG
jgi:hypothetical protein